MTLKTDWRGRPPWREATGGTIPDAMRKPTDLEIEAALIVAMVAVALAGLLLR
jgi:hypothetical protein